MTKFFLGRFVGVLLGTSFIITAGHAQDDSNLYSFASALRFSDDGKTLLGATAVRFAHPPTSLNDFDSRVRLYDGFTGRQKQVLPAHPIRNGYPGVLFLPDFKTMFTTWGAWDVKAVSLRAYTVTDIIPVSNGNIGQFVLSRDEKTFVVGMTRAVEVRDFPSQKVRYTLRNGGQGTSVNFGPNDKEILCWWYDNWHGVQAQCFDVATGQQIRYPRWVYRVRGSNTWQFSPDGQTVALVKGQTIEIWTTPTEESPGHKLRSMKVPFLQTQTLAFSPDSKRLAVGGRSSTSLPLVVFNLETFLTS